MSDRDDLERKREELKACLKANARLLKEAQITAQISALCVKGALTAAKGLSYAADHRN